MVKTNGVDYQTSVGNLCFLEEEQRFKGEETEVGKLRELCVYTGNSMFLSTWMGVFSIVSMSLSQF